MTFAGEPFRRNMDVSVEIEPDGPPPRIKFTLITTYSVVSVGEGTRYKVPSPTLVDILPGLPNEDHVVEWKSRVIPRGGQAIENAHYTLHPVTQDGVERLQVEKDFEFDIAGEVTYHERCTFRCVMGYPWQFALRTEGRAREVTVSVHWPGATNFSARIFGDLSPRSTVDTTGAGITVHYDDWMVKGHGVVIEFLPPPGYLVHQNGQAINT
jgi:hypothetical protein